MAKRWRVRPHDSARIAALEREARVSPVVAQLLIARGICDPRDVHSFLNPKLAGLRDPAALEKLPESERAACREVWNEVETLLKKCAESNEK